VNPQELWKTSLAQLQLSISPANFATWFRGTSITRVEEDLVEIACPNPFTKAWLEERYLADIAAAVSGVLGRSVRLSFIIVSNPQPGRRVTAAPLFDSAEEEKRQTLQKLSSAGLSPRYTLENFVVGNNNQLAYAVAQAIISKPGKVYNPFFLYGGVGVGKTHLMQAIGHAVLKAHPNHKVVYCTGEAFTNGMIEAIQNRRTSSFRRDFREVDLLLIDDIQFIAGREGTQEEFFHTFNALHGAGRQVVMTSDRPPKEIAKLEERLRSRFEWGMIADIQPPDKDMRVAILSFKCRELGLKLPFEVANLLAERVASVRDLEGALMRVATTAQLSGTPVTVELAQKVVGTTDEPARRKAINPKEVLDHVAEEFSIKVSDLRGERRYKEIVLPRQITMYILRTDFSLPLMRVAEMLGGRDHTTIMHGVERCEKLLSQDEEIKDRVEAIRDRLYG
jgi:chromosomal replication initiator protein